MENKIHEQEYDECNLRGICSISPVLSAMKSVIFGSLRELAFYTIRLHSLGICNVKIKNHFIETFSALISNSEYSEESFHNTVKNIHEILSEVKSLYKELCEKDNIPIKYYKSQIKLKPDFSLTDVLRQGQKYSENFKKRLSDDKEKSLEIILIVLKSICLYIVELQSLNVDIDKYYRELLFALGARGLNSIPFEQLAKLMDKYVELNYELMNMVFKARKKEFGEFIETDISISPKEGKAILVSGTNLKELEILLEATKDSGINIYTHGQMITAHILPKFKNYPHLVGHWGKSVEHYISDFSLFPGPIFMTKLSLFRVESLYSSSLFTTDIITSKGIGIIKNYNFEKLIHCAKLSEGFCEKKAEKTIHYGIIEQNFMDEIDKLTQKIQDNTIKTVFIIGASNRIDSLEEYFKKFLSLLKDDCFVISFYYKNHFKNILYTNIDYTFPFFYKALDKLLPLQKICDFNINIIFTRCELHSIPNLINLKRIGLEKIYLPSCSPHLLNPSLVDFLIEKLNLKKYSSPENDLRTMFEN